MTDRRSDAGAPEKGSQVESDFAEALRLIESGEADKPVLRRFVDVEGNTVHEMVSSGILITGMTIQWGDNPFEWKIVGFEEGCVVRVEQVGPAKWED